MTTQSMRRGVVSKASMLLLALGVTLFFWGRVAGGDPKDPDKKELEALQGKWRATEQWTFGEQERPEWMAKLKLSIELSGDNFVLMAFGKPEEGVFTLDCSKA